VSGFFAHLPVRPLACSPPGSFACFSRLQNWLNSSAPGIHLWFAPMLLLLLLLLLSLGRRRLDAAV